MNIFLYLAIFFFLLWIIFRKLYRKPPEEWKLYGKIVVVLICKDCNEHQQTGFDPNYNVGQKISIPCPSCGGQVYVEKIYLEPDPITEKEVQKYKKYEDTFR